MIEKMNMETKNIAKDNIEKLAELFPNVITEMIDEDKSTPEHKVYKKGINFQILKQILSDNVLDGDESYEFTWVGKKASIVEANKPIRKTLRPCKEESKDWDTTENLYIEGDNLDVLKLLQESYLGAIKMIYIDPPYNTGNDFIYRDDFSQTADEYNEALGVYDENSNKLFINTERNGRFHSDWCSMIYSRLQLANKLLSDDGVIFISIDDYEVENMIKIADEIFGESNSVGMVVWERAFAPKNDAKYISSSHDYIVIYAKNLANFSIGKLDRTEEANSRYKNPDNDPRGNWASDNLTVKTYSAAYDYEIITPSGKVIKPTDGRCWFTSKERMDALIKDNRVWFGENGDNMPRLKRFLSDVQNGMVPTSIWYNKDVGHNQEGRQELKKLFDDKGYFDGPKPVRLLDKMIKVANLKNDSIVLDFFSGSATTAQAVIKSNISDNAHRKFIMVQLPEEYATDSEAYKAGYKNICHIGKERIRRAGDKIKEEAGLIAQELDIGFRVFKLDSTNMKDVYYSASELNQSMLDILTSNIKEDRTDLDLLFGCLLEWGLPLSLPHKFEKIENVTIHIINDGDLIACFDENVSDAIIKEIAKKQPLRVVFRDSSFDSSPAKINVEEIFSIIAPNTKIKVI